MQTSSLAHPSTPLVALVVVHYYTSTSSTSRLRPSSYRLTPIPPRSFLLAPQQDQARAKANKRKFSASDAAPNAQHVAKEVATGHMVPLGREQVRVC